MKKAPAEIQRIVWAVLRNGTANCILIQPEPLGEIKKLLRDGRKASASVQEFLRNHAGDVFEAEVDPECKFYAAALYVMCPERVENGVRRRMYVKFALNEDRDDESLSDITIIRFHKSTGSTSISRLP
jgi:hypothetical protein